MGSMKYILTAGWDDGIADLTSRLARELAQNKKILWLLSGGSNIPASVSIMNNIPTEHSSGLSISLADERYGEPGHSESNWAKLMQAGFDSKEATLLPVLMPGLSLEETVASYSQMIDSAMSQSDLTIAQLGIGEDGHIAGILPGSAPATETQATVLSFEDPPLVRLSLTFAALKRVNVAYAFAFGEPKKVALHSLQSETVEPTILPAQILKQIQEAYLYSDQVGEHI